MNSIRSISSIVEDLGRSTVTLGGKEVSIRALSSHESDRLYSLFPPPQPPPMKDPNAGSLAPKVPNLNDAGYIDARRTWDSFTSLLFVAVALELTDDEGKAWDPAGSDEDVRQWCIGIADGVSKAVPRQQISAAFNRLMDLMEGDEAALQRALIVELPEGTETSERAEELRLPERYGISDLSVFLRICERFGMDPFVALRHSSPPALWRILATHDRVRHQEETALAAAMRGKAC